MTQIPLLPYGLMGLSLKSTCVSVIIVVQRVKSNPQCVKSTCLSMPTKTTPVTTFRSIATDDDDTAPEGILARLLPQKA